MSVDNKSRQAAFKQRMRDAGKKAITIWVTPEQEQAVRALLTPSEAGEGAALIKAPTMRKAKKKAPD